MLKEDPVRLELSLTPSYGKSPVVVGLVESLDLVARRDREGRMPRDSQGTWTGLLGMVRLALEVGILF